MEPGKREFIQAFENRVRETIRKHKLLGRGDRVLVACSGGKDSTAVLYLLNKFGYRPEGLTIDLQMGEWSEENLRNLLAFCKTHGITLHTVSLTDFGFDIHRIRSWVNDSKSLTCCTVCGVLKRWVLNRLARRLGATKIATGHNLDDEAQTCIMNLVNGNPKLGINMGPRTGIADGPGFVARIKPLFFIRDKESRKYAELMGFRVMHRRCPYAASGQRWKMRDFLNRLEENEPGSKQRIVEATLDIFREIRQGLKPGQIKHCRECREPARSELCKACQVLKEFNQLTSHVSSGNFHE